MPLSGIELLLWLASTVGNIVLLAVLIFRRRSARLWVFTAFTASNVLRTAILFFLYRKQLSTAYFYAYWTLALVDLLLQIAVIYDIASIVFRPAGRWAPDARRHLLLLISGAVLFAAGLTWLAAGGQSNWVESTVVKGSFLSSVLMAELFAGMVVLSVRAGLPWAGDIARVAYGFGVYSLVDVLVEAGHNVFGKGYTSSLDIDLANGRAFVYICCLGYWIVSLWSGASVQLRSSRAAVDAAAMWHEALNAKPLRER